MKYQEKIWFEFIHYWINKSCYKSLSIHDFLESPLININPYFLNKIENFVDVKFTKQKKQDIDLHLLNIFIKKINTMDLDITLMQHKLLKEIHFNYGKLLDAKDLDFLTRKIEKGWIKKNFFTEHSDQTAFEYFNRDSIEQIKVGFKKTKKKPLPQFLLILGADHNDDMASVKRKYLKLCLKNHPDLNMENKEHGDEIMKKLNDAYDKAKKYFLKKR